MQRQVEEIIKLLGTLLEDGRYESVDEYLDLCESAAPLMEPPLLLAILSLSYPAKDRLKKRESLVKAVEARLQEKIGNSRAQELLENRR